MRTPRHGKNFQLSRCHRLPLGRWYVVRAAVLLGLFPAISPILSLFSQDTNYSFWVLVVYLRVNKKEYPYLCRACWMCICICQGSLAFSDWSGLLQAQARLGRIFRGRRHQSSRIRGSATVFLRGRHILVCAHILHMRVVNFGIVSHGNVPPSGPIHSRNEIKPEDQKERRSHHKALYYKLRSEHRIRLPLLIPIHASHGYSG